MVVKHSCQSPNPLSYPLPLTMMTGSCDIHQYFDTTTDHKRNHVSVVVGKMRFFIRLTCEYSALLVHQPVINFVLTEDNLVVAHHM